MGYVEYTARRHYADEGRWMKSDPALAAAVRLAAEDVAVEATIIVQSEAFATGALAASIDVERENWTDRVGYAVVAEDPAAAPTEFGNRRMPAEEVVSFLVDAAENVGLDVRDEE